MVQIQGSVELDDGAVRVLRESGRSLLPVGCAVCRAISPAVIWCPVAIPTAARVARGLVNYSAEETRRIMGSASSEIEPFSATSWTRS